MLPTVPRTRPEGVIFTGRVDAQLASDRKITDSDQSLDAVLCGYHSGYLPKIGWTTRFVCRCTGRSSSTHPRPDKD